MSLYVPLCLFFGLKAIICVDVLKLLPEKLDSDTDEASDAVVILTSQLVEPPSLLKTAYMS